MVLPFGLHPIIRVTVSQLIHYRYAFFIPVAIFEGTTVAFLSGVLVAAGVFNPWAAYSVLIIGDLIPDSIWYWAGRHMHKRDLLNRFGHHIGVTEQRLGFLLDLWRKHPSKTVVLSKIAYGMGAPMLTAAGYARISWKRFYGTAVPVSAVQYGILMMLGAGTHRTYRALLPYVRYTGFLAAVFIIVILVAAAISSKKARDMLVSGTQTR
ncbi:MAG TPA: VTT domain-containing protein [Candidatus Paceibacterota bacterium]|nr:VTT domain-containing protein [Candidatus Paceibacterota bacterium]